MQRQKNNTLEWLEFDLLNDIPNLKHAVFLRQGGCSSAPFNTLNSSYYVGDEQENVKRNIDRIKEELQLRIPNWKRQVWGLANHGKSLALIDHNSPEEVADVDGILTKTPGITLTMRHADCQIALFYDPKLHIAANVHAGWRGSVLNIFGETVRYMKEAFGSQPANLLVCITPSLGPDEAEFIHYRSELPEEFWHFQSRPTYFDFWSISEFQLQAAGILPHHIEMARLSTYTNSYDFFSHRRDKKTGRHATCITLL